MLMLKRHLSAKQWLSLLLLCGGVMLVQVSRQQDICHANVYTRYFFQFHGSRIHKTASSASPQFDGDVTFGLLCVLGACLTSGISGVYFEMLVKTSAQKSVIIRNLQLGN